MLPNSSLRSCSFPWDWLLHLASLACWQVLWLMLIVYTHCTHVSSEIPRREVQFQSRLDAPPLALEVHLPPLGRLGEVLNAQACSGSIPFGPGCNLLGPVGSPPPKGGGMKGVHASKRTQAQFQFGCDFALIC